ncbi:MAG: hypothetical protein GXY48_12060 [Methanomicrobiales archaeon]|nr:hypothetical protein [Methanomicrobiales archaeon]
MAVTSRPGGIKITEFSSICQSCAMPFMKDEDYGTESDGSRSNIYCTYCYQNGKFTDDNCNVEKMAEIGAGMMSQMFGMPLDKARMFMQNQISPLKRWSGRIVPSCQSCGMPLFSPEDAGTEEDETPSYRYCVYCYQHGAFTEPDLTQDAMIEKSAPFIASQLEMSLDKAKEMSKVFTSTLSRWK